MNILLQKFTVYDLLIIAIMATVGIALKPVVVPLAHLISGPLMIPGGALAGGLYMLWLVTGYGIVGKPGTTTLVALVQALLVLFTGVIGSHGIMSLFTYTMPGIAIDIVMLASGHRVCCKNCAVLAGAVSNVMGTACVNVIFFRVPGVYLTLILSVALLSGALGGLLACELLKVLRKFHLIAIREKIKVENKSKYMIPAFAVLCMIVGITAFMNANLQTGDSSGYFLTISRQGETVDVISMEEIMNMESISVETELQSAQYDDERGIYTGVVLTDILALTDADLLSDCTKFITRAGDSYSSALSLEDIADNNVLVVYKKDGKMLTPFEDGGAGPMRIMILSDTYGNRSTKYLIGIDCR